MIHYTPDSLWKSLCLCAIGTDLTEIRRFRLDEGVPPQAGAGTAVDESFLRLVFTERERAYCQAQREPERHFAGCYAVKEATVKAIGGAAAPPIAVPQIEVLPDPRTGHFVPRVASRRGETVPNLYGMRFFASISYSGPFAIAFVVAAQEGEGEPC